MIFFPRVSRGLAQGLLLHSALIGASGFGGSLGMYNFCGRPAGQGAAGATTPRSPGRARVTSTAQVHTCAQHELFFALRPTNVSRARLFRSMALAITYRLGALRQIFASPTESFVIPILGPVYFCTPRLLCRSMLVKILPCRRLHNFIITSKSQQTPWGQIVKILRPGVNVG